MALTSYNIYKLYYLYSLFMLLSTAHKFFPRYAFLHKLSFLLEKQLLPTTIKQKNSSGHLLLLSATVFVPPSFY